MWVFVLVPIGTPASVVLPSSLYIEPSTKAFIRTTFSNSKKASASSWLTQEGNFPQITISLAVHCRLDKLALHVF